MKKISKRIISAILTVSMLFTLSATAMAEDLNSYIMSSGDKKNYLNRLAVGEERVEYGSTIILDNVTETGRNIITIDGSDTSTYNENFASGIATLSVNGQITEVYDMNKLRESITTWTMPEEDKLLFNKYFSNPLSKSINTSPQLPDELRNKYSLSEDESGIIITPIEKNRTVRAAAQVRPYSTVTKSYPPYTYKKVSSKTLYSSICSRSLVLSVKDSMYSYSLASKTERFFSIGTAVSVIAGIFDVASGALLNSLQGYTSVVSGILQLATNVNYFFSEDYNFYALRQGCVFDYTRNNRDVSVNTQTGTGRLSMTWDFVAGSYQNPKWKVTAQAYPHTIPFSTIYNESQRIWETNIQQYGYWKWGDA